MTRRSERKSDGLGNGAPRAEVVCSYDGNQAGDAVKGGQRIGAGRPADPDSRRLVVQARVSEEELERIKQTAEHYGMKVSDLVRKALGL